MMFNVKLPQEFLSRTFGRFFSGMNFENLEKPGMSLGKTMDKKPLFFVWCVFGWKAQTDFVCSSMIVLYWKLRNLSNDFTKRVSFWETKMGVPISWGIHSRHHGFLWLDDATPNTRVDTSIRSWAFGRIPMDHLYSQQILMIFPWWSYCHIVIRYHLVSYGGVPK